MGFVLLGCFSELRSLSWSHDARRSSFAQGNSPPPPAHLRTRSLDCGGKRSATPLWFAAERCVAPAKAPSPLRSAGTLQNWPSSRVLRLFPLPLLAASPGCAEAKSTGKSPESAGRNVCSTLAWDGAELGVSRWGAVFPFSVTRRLSVVRLSWPCVRRVYWACLPLEGFFVEAAARLAARSFMPSR